MGKNRQKSTILALLDIDVIAEICQKSAILEVDCSFVLNVLKNSSF